MVIHVSQKGINFFQTSKFWFEQKSRPLRAFSLPPRPSPPVEGHLVLTLHLAELPSVHLGYWNSVSGDSTACHGKARRGEHVQGMYFLCLLMCSMDPSNFPYKTSSEIRLWRILRLQQYSLSLDLEPLRHLKSQP